MSLRRFVCNLLHGGSESDNILYLRPVKEKTTSKFAVPYKFIRWIKILKLKSDEIENNSNFHSWFFDRLLEIKKKKIIK